jgi:hypothetical protein
MRLPSLVVRRLRWSDVPFIAALIIIAYPQLAEPQPTLDSSWSTGVAWARQLGLPFGLNIDFTYGPLEFLDVSTLFNGPMLLASLVAYTVSGWAVLEICRRLLSRWLSPMETNLTLLIVVTPAFLVDSHFSSRVLAFGVAVALALLIGVAPQSAARWLLPFSALVAVIASQVKFSNGLLALATVAIAAVLSPGSLRTRLFRLSVIIITILAGTPLVWLLAGQRLPNFPPWLRASLDLTSGYADAMATEPPGALWQYFLFVGVLALTGVQVALTWRALDSRVLLLLLALWVAAMALRLGFTRHDLGHAIQSFDLLLIVNIALGSVTRARIAILAPAVATVAVLTSGFASSLISTDPIQAARQIHINSLLVVSPKYRSQVISAAMDRSLKYYGLEPQVRQVIGSDSVHIDPSDAMLAWAYQLNWDPVPVMQAYSAYTPYLDRLNANYLASANGPDVVVRAQVYAIDGRNPMWESPQYMKSLVCNFSVPTQSTRWMVAKKVADRCSQPTEIGHQRFTAGQKITVPNSPDKNTMIVASIKLDADPLNAAATTLFKPLTLVSVATTQNPSGFRLPRQHAAGPLIVQMPSDAGWNSPFGGHYSTGTLELNVSGSITFSAIAVR